MREELIQFETAKLAKEKGFNENVYDLFKTTFSEESATIEQPLDKPRSNKYYKNESKNNIIYLRPTQSLLQKWLRDKHTIDITVIINFKKGKRIYYVGLSYINENNEIDIWFSVKDTIKIEYNTYEEALEIGLQEGLKLIKNEKGKI